MSTAKNGNLTRREALGRAARWAGVAALWAGLPQRTWAALPAPAGWSATEEALTTLVGDTILPATPGSPGAGDVAIGRFVLAMTNDCFAPEAAAATRRALREIEAAAQAAHGKAFAALAAAEREAVLTAYEKTSAASAAAAVRAKAGGEAALDAFRHVKQLVLLGYFTSEPGATQALRYDPVPGGYRGSLPLAPGDRAWAT